MSIQTDGLRRYVRQRGPDGSGGWRDAAAQGFVVVVGAGKGGAGGSLVTALLGLACAAEGRRTLIIDGDEQVGTLHRLFGVDAPHGLEALRSGDIAPISAVIDIDPLLSLVPGGCGTGHVPVTISLTERRFLFRRLSVLYGEYDLVLIDAGSRVDGVVAAAGPAAHRFITVGGVDPVGLAASYALVKTIDARWPGAPIDLLINRHTEARARDAFHYVRSATERFLGRGLEYSGTIPEDEELGAVILAGHALAHMAANTLAGRSMQLVAAKLLADLDAGTRRELSPQQVKNSRR